jgi:predicted nucleotidyltransferase
MEEIKDAIVAEINPDKIILFGSYARGNNNEHSDIDLMILKKNPGNVRQVASKACVCLRFVQKPLDIIVMDTDFYHEKINRNGLIYKTINKEGKILHE